jgi:hypothetical protein
MQTFLPYTSFSQSARCLDRQRLGKQRVEAFQILQALENPNYGWQNHPAIRMWRGHNRLLCLYGLEICSEWKQRGYKDSMSDRFYNRLVQLDDLWFNVEYNENIPSWLGSDVFHASHRSNLLRKNPEYYGKFGWTESTDLEYVWPIK